MTAAEFHEHSAAPVRPPRWGHFFRSPFGIGVEQPPMVVEVMLNRDRMPIARMLRAFITPAMRALSLSIDPIEQIS
jgi:hypothetical protein